MLAKTYLLILFTFLLIPFTSFGQCPDAISGVVNITSNDGTNCTFNVEVDITSNGNSSAEIWIVVNDNGAITEYDNTGTCDVTSLSGTVSLNYGPYTAPCSAEITVHYLGHSSPSCGGSTCSGFFLPILVLPIELTYFKGRQVENDIVLQWETASENNNMYFEIQHSLDGVAFQTLEKINSLRDSDGITNYQYLHQALKRGQHYYRIKQVDFDGTFEIFNAIVVDFKIVSAEQFRVYPTSVTDLLTIEWSAPSERKTDVFIYNYSGALVDTNAIYPNESSVQYNVSHLPSGLYFIGIKNDEVQFEGMQFIKLTN